MLSRPPGQQRQPTGGVLHRTAKDTAIAKFLLTSQPISIATFLPSQLSMDVPAYSIATPFSATRISHLILCKGLGAFLIFGPAGSGWGPTTHELNVIGFREPSPLPHLTLRLHGFQVCTDTTQHDTVHVLGPSPLPSPRLPSC